jgi:hypothetical protein
VQLCLVTPSAKAHHDICDAKMGALSAKNQQRLDGLFLKAAE